MTTNNDDFIQLRRSVMEVILLLQFVVVVAVSQVKLVELQAATRSSIE